MAKLYFRFLNYSSSFTLVLRKFCVNLVIKRYQGVMLVLLLWYREFFANVYKITLIDAISLKFTWLIDSRTLFCKDSLNHNKLLCMPAECRVLARQRKAIIYWLCSDYYLELSNQDLMFTNWYVMMWICDAFLWNFKSLLFVEIWIHGVGHLKLECNANSEVILW